MKLLLDKWQPTKRLGKIIKSILNIVLLILLLAFIVTPFLRLDGGWKEAFKWMWIGIAILHLDQFAEYKKAREEKLIYPIFSLIATLTLFYLCNYWSLIPLCVAIVCSIVIGLLELGISVKVYEAMRFTAKAELKPLPPKATDTILLGSMYSSAVSLFILGHFLDKSMIFVFGIIAMIILFSHVLSVISKGFGASKSIVSTIGIILDIVSVLFLIGYLIYLIPGGEENNNLQEIVLALASAVIGGALTLAGVAWTIKKTEQDNRQQEIQKAKPFFHFLASLSDNIPDTQMICYANIPTTVEKPIMNIVHLINSDNSNFYIREIKYLGKWYTVEISNCVIKNRDICLIFQTDSETWDGKYIIVRTEDILGNSYYYVFGFATHENENHEKYNSISCIKEVPEEFAKQ